MKRSILLLPLVIAAVLTTLFAQAPAGGQGRGGRPNIFAPEAKATPPLSDVVNSMVTAFNNKDTAFFQKLIVPDAVWLDEDGHHLLATVWANRVLSSTTPRKLSVSNLRTSNWGDGGWAAFNYVIAEGTNQVKGTNSLVFKKNGNDWQVVLIHAAVDTAFSPH